MHASLHESAAPSAWVQRFAGLIPQGEVLDLACGSGRHAFLLAALGHPVTAVDRDPLALARCAGAGITACQVDLETDDARAGWPFGPARFSGIVVTRYLHRPLLPLIVESLAPGGILIYETFATGNGEFGKPSNPAFLLAPGELLELAASSFEHALRVIAYEDGYVEIPNPAMLQRICAVKPSLAHSATALRLN